MASMNIRQNKEMYLWIGILRIIATFLIYLIHFYVISEGIRISVLIDYTAIGIFCFISGFLSFRSKLSPESWLKKRIAAIMIPYWSVIFFVILINEMIGYKESSWVENILVVLGFGNFMGDHIYVISWFITLINLMYLHAYSIKKVKGRIGQVIVLCLSFWLFCKYFWVDQRYFVAFYLGYYAKSWTVADHLLEKLNRFLTKRCVFPKMVNQIQDHCYSFFLIHGGILLFFKKILFSPAIVIFLGGIIITGFLSIFHKRFSDFLIKRV